MQNIEYIVQNAKSELVWNRDLRVFGPKVVSVWFPLDRRKTLIEKNYSKLFGETPFKSIENFNHYSPIINW